MPGRQPSDRSKRAAPLSRPTKPRPKPPATDSHPLGVPINADAHFALLTPREREVLTLWLDGFNDKKVAARLGTKVQTVRNQIASIEHKLGARSREELVALTHSLND